jgi:hypothetical protein
MRASQREARMMLQRKRIEYAVAAMIGVAVFSNLGALWRTGHAELDREDLISVIFAGIAIYVIWPRVRPKEGQ